MKSSTYRDPSVSVLSVSIIEFILISNRIGERILPWGTPCSWGCQSEYSVPTLVWNVLFCRKFSIKIGRFPLRPILWRSRSIPVFQVVSNAFSMSKKTTVTCSPFRKALRMKVSNLTNWSRVDLFFLKPLWNFEIFLFVSKNHISLLLTSFSMSLHRQLVNAMGL